MINQLDKKIFLVDDDELILKTFSKHLSNLGYTDLTTFQNGASAINALSEDPFLIFLDYQMDDMTGFDVLRKIKRHNPDTYVIMLSSQKDLSNAVETLKFGAFDYIIKGEGDMPKITRALERLDKLESHLLAPRKTLFQRLFG